MGFGYLEKINDVPFPVLSEAQGTEDLITDAQTVATAAVTTAALAKAAGITAAADAASAAAEATTAVAAALQCVADAATAQSLADEGNTAASSGLVKAQNATADIFLTQADISAYTTALADADVPGAVTAVQDAETAVSLAESSQTSAATAVSTATTALSATRYYSYGRIDAQSLVKPQPELLVRSTLTATVLSGNVPLSSGTTFTLPEGKLFRLRVNIVGTITPSGYYSVLSILLGGTQVTRVFLFRAGYYDFYTRGNFTECVVDTTGLAEAARQVTFALSVEYGTSDSATATVTSVSRYYIQEI